MNNTLTGMIEGDRVDARAMAAVDVLNEILWRVHGLDPYTAARRIEIYGDEGLRMEIEGDVGEPLV